MIAIKSKWQYFLVENQFQDVEHWGERATIKLGLDRLLFDI